MIHGVTPRLALAVDGGGLKLRAVRGREAQAASPEPCGERGSAEPTQD